jgi:glycosyltransferase involved in cell wall biosynthesis
MEQPTICVAVLTFNRFHFLRQTLASMDAHPGYPFKRVLVDGGSSDDQQRAWVAHQPNSYVFENRVTVGYSMNTALDMAAATGASVIVFSADDYLYKPRWAARLLAFWQAAPSWVGLASLNWEPVYPWNTVLEDLVIGGERTLIRATLPGSSWSFPARHWRTLIGPLADQTGGEDLTVCRDLQARGYKLAALDLSEHIGERESAWGNRSWERAEPLVLDGSGIDYSWPPS